MSAPVDRVATDRNRTVPVAQPGEFSPLCLGALSVWPPVVLAPMAGVTNYPFRRLCRSQGAGLYVSEMITARGYLLDNRMTHLLARSAPDERPRSIQVYGADPIDVGEMVRRLVDEGIDHVDLNLGCPVRKVTSTGGGSAIPAKPRLMARLVRAMVKNAGSVPVTVKVRKGIDESVLTFDDAGRIAEAEGAAAIGLHARTAADLYAGAADWSAIGELKSKVAIAVLGNGDIWEAWDALRMMRATGCDGVIVGRGCLGRPWLFRELAQAFAGTEPDPPPSLFRIRTIMLEHARGLCDFFGTDAGIRQMRKWTAWYTKGFRHSATLRGRLQRVRTLAELEAILDEFPEDEPFPVGALRAARAKRGRRQRVSLPPGYLDQRDDDAPPKSPHTPAEIAAWERALSGG